MYLNMCLEVCPQVHITMEPQHGCQISALTALHLTLIGRDSCWTRSWLVRAELAIQIAPGITCHCLLRAVLRVQAAALPARLLHGTRVLKLWFPCLCFVCFVHWVISPDTDAILLRIIYYYYLGHSNSCVNASFCA